MKHHDLSMKEAIEWWSTVDKNGTDKVGIRALCLIDRFYLLVQVCKRYDMLHPWIYKRCREVEQAPNGYIDLWAREHYKDLADTTPMLTANKGWTTHGDLTPGDVVFAPDGSPVKVLAVTPQYLDSECYEVQFQGGALVVAGAGHLWKLRQKHRLRVSGSTIRRVDWSESVVTTQDLRANTGRCDVGSHEPLKMPMQQLPIDPYVLGCWLGDGTSADSRFCQAFGDVEVLERIRSKGVEVREYPGRKENTGCYILGPGIRGQRNTGLNSELRKLGILGDKHIPEMYLRASVYQRMELLRGLMDTDGHCNARGTATFVQVSGLLANQVYDLATSLALRPRIRHYENGGKGFYQVSLQAHTDRNPFSLTRKAGLAIPPSEHRECQNIVSIKRIKSVPTRCIQVEGSMYLAGRELIPTHNSTIVTFGGSIQRILQDPEVTIGIFSHVNTIASDFLRQIKVELESNQTLKAVFPDVLWNEPAKEAQRWSVDGGIVVRRKSNPKESTVEASGLVDGQPISKHYKLRIYDDVVTDKSVSTPEQVAKTTDAYSLSQSLGVIGGDQWTVGTRYSYADTYEWILKRGALLPRLYPATKDGTREGEPVFFTAKEWKKRLLNNTDNDIACQYLQNPLSGQQRMFNIEELQVYEVRPATLSVYVMCDPARSKKKDSANTAIMVVGVDYAMNKYLLDGMNHKMDLKERWENFAGMYVRWTRMPGVQMVRMGYETFGAQADMDYFEEQMKLPGRPSFEIVELAWPREGEGSKIDRVQRLTPDVRSGKWFLPMDTDPKRLTSIQKTMHGSGYDFRIAQPIKRKDHEGQIYDLTEQLKMQMHYFPFGGQKDAVDALSRIYDMEIKAPRLNEPSYSEPEFT